MNPFFEMINDNDYQKTCIYRCLSFFKGDSILFYEKGMPDPIDMTTNECKEKYLSQLIVILYNSFESFFRQEYISPIIELKSNPENPYEIAIEVMEKSLIGEIT